MKYAWFLALLLATGITYADIYMQKEADGTEVYSDVPMGENSTPLSLKPLNEVPSTAVEQPASDQAGSDKAKSGTEASDEKTAPSDADPATVGYKVFSIASPTNEQTFYNQPIIPVSMTVVPSLKEGDQIQLMVDGAAVGSSSSNTTIGLHDVERGSHLLQAKIIGKNKQTIASSAPITIYVHKSSVDSKR